MSVERRPTGQHGDQCGGADGGRRDAGAAAAAVASASGSTPMAREVMLATIDVAVVPAGMSASMSAAYIGIWVPNYGVPIAEVGWL